MDAYVRIKPPCSISTRRKINGYIETTATEGFYAAIRGHKEQVRVSTLTARPLKEVFGIFTKTPCGLATSAPSRVRPEL